MSQLDRQSPLDCNLPALPLSSRELQILVLIAQGNKQQTIAMELIISPRTVRNHLQNINHKLGTTSSITAIIKALQLDLIQLDTL